MPSACHTSHLFLISLLFFASALSCHLHTHPYSFFFSLLQLCSLVLLCLALGSACAPYARTIPPASVLVRANVDLRRCRNSVASPLPHIRIWLIDNCWNIQCHYLCPVT